MTNVPATVTKELFSGWRSPRRGSINPDDMTNDIWRWLANSRISAYQANELLKGPSSFDAGPCWCFDRFGQSETFLPDGRSVLVAGEHEDYYDPDFYIYNDVVVVDNSGEVSVFGYPTDVFPPTDFHTATLLDDSLVLIGSLGYSQDRCSGRTQVLRLELDTWRISTIETTGCAPGWIHGHTATLSSTGTEILVTGGKIDRCDGTDLIENIDEWSLDTRTWCWKRITHRSWARFQVHRTDMARNHLWDMRQLLWSRSVGWDDIQEQTDKLMEALGGLPDLDLLETLYAPKLATEVLGEDGEQYGTFRIRAGDVVVRYVEDSFVIQFTVEGKLPESVLEELQKDITDKLAALERTPITCKPIQPQ